MADLTTPPHLTTWDDLDALVSDSYTGMTNAFYLYPPFPFPFFVHGGYATLADNGDLTGATNLFVSSTLLDVPVWHVWVNETQLTERVWQIIGASNICFRTNAVPPSFDPQAWVRVNYGQPPSYLTGTKLAQWYANRDRSRLHLGFKLIASNDWPTLQAAFAAAATNTPTPDTSPPTMPLDTNRLAFAGIETSYSNVTTRLWIYTPTSEQVDVFARTALTPVTNLWELRGTLDATAPFDIWEASSVDLPVAFFHAALAGIDTDGDGLPDGREILTHGTDPNALDTDGDGLGDFTEIYRYDTSALLADTDGDGLSDYEEIALGSNPLTDDTDGDGLTDLTEEYETFTLFADSDTDNDGLTDYEEVVLYDTSPFGSDTDCDGLDDYDEVALGTLPTLADTDGDGICDYTEVYLDQYLSPTDPTDADDDIDNDAFNNLLEYQNFWLMTSPTNGYESAKYQLICINPGSNSILFKTGGLTGIYATFALGDAGPVSSILRIPPTKEVGGTIVKELYHSGSPHVRLDGTPLSELASPIMVPDTAGSVDYRLSALPSSQGTNAVFRLGNNQGVTNTLTCYIPKVTTTEFRDRNSTRHVNVALGATGTFVVAWSPDPHHAAGVHISPTVWPTYVSGVPLLTSRDYLLARVTGDTTNFTASLNYYRYDSARLARRGLILPVGKHLVAVGLDWNLDGQLQDDEVSMACDVYVVKPDLGIQRANGNPVPDAVEGTSGSVVRLAPKINPSEMFPDGLGLALEAPTLTPTSALGSAVQLKLKSERRSYATGTIRIYRDGTVFMDGNVNTQTNLTESNLGGAWCVDATSGGVVDLSLIAYDMTGVELCRDTVRISAIPCAPATGRIVFVNPYSTSPRPPYDDFISRAAHSIQAALAIAQSGDNILVAPVGPYREQDLPLVAGGVVAGLAGHWLVNDPSLETGPLAAVFNYDYLPRVIPSATVPRSMFSVGNGSQSITLAGFRLEDGQAVFGTGEGGAICARDRTTPLKLSHIRFAGNRASNFGGAVSLNQMSDVRIDMCRFESNLCQYDDGGEVCYTRGMGGAIASCFSSLLVTNCVFQDNMARVVTAGTAPEPGSAGGGGDIYIRHGALCWIRSASQGAVAGYPVGAEVRAENGYFTGDGGALLVHGFEEDTTLQLRDINIEEATSFGNGGAISLSRNSVPDARAYFIKAIDWQPSWPPAVPVAEPDDLGGGCVATISNVTFTSCRGGWQGGAISANGRHMYLDIVNCKFLNCSAGLVHLRDGKAGAIAVCGGVQQDLPSQNDVLVRQSTISGCTASGNGGGLYVTIRGMLRLQDTTVTNCAAQDAGTRLTFGDDFRKIEGMGGGLHVSAGGIAWTEPGNPATPTTFLSNTAVNNGGGVSVKTGKLYITEPTILSGNSVSGLASDGYGNGGGIFVTTSYYDDWLFFNAPNQYDESLLNPGAGSFAAIYFNDDGFLLADEATLFLSGNSATRWGGGLYAGLPPPWVPGTPPANYAATKVTVQGATITGNHASTSAAGTTALPSQVTAERVATQGTAVLDFTGSLISGNASQDIGIYGRTSITIITNGVTFTSLLVPMLEN